MTNSGLDLLRKRLTSARDLLAPERRRRTDPPLPIGLPAADTLLDGGLTRGALVELVGHHSSGRFSLVLAALAAATRGGEAAALVDLGDGFDPQSAERAGVELPRLLWLRPRRLKEALASAEMLLASGFPLVILELGVPPVAGGRGQEAGWLRLARAAQTQRSALLVSAPYRVSGTAAARVIGTRGERSRWLGGYTAAVPLLAGLDTRLQLDKVRGRATTAAPGALRLALPAALAYPVEGAEGAAVPSIPSPHPLPVSAPRHALAGVR